MKILFSILFAHDLGCFGETFSIQEQNMIEMIQEKLKRIPVGIHQKIIQERIKKTIEKPKNNKEVVTTKMKKTFVFDPSIVVSKDLKDHRGKVFIKRGTKINPLHIRSLTKTLLFINGDDKNQLKWAKNKLQKHRLAKIILIKGEPLKLMKKWKKPIYFDQQGLLVKKLGIRHVPAFVTQKNDVLEIQEVKPDED